MKKIKQTNNFKLYSIRSIFFVLIMLAGCSGMKVAPSRWDNNTLKIDGKDNEWQNDLRYFPDEKIMVGIKNDADNLYVCLKTNDEMNIRKIMAAGLTLWLNTKDNKSKKFGIHYPVGGAGRRDFTQGRDADDPSADERIKAEMPGNHYSGMMEEMLKKIEININDNEDLKIGTIDEFKKNYNIQVSLKNENDILFYEIAIPLKSQFLNINNNGTKAIIGLGMLTGEYKRPERSGNQRGYGDGGGPTSGGIPGMGSGGYGGSGRRGGGMHGGGMRGSTSQNDMKSLTEPLELWLEVELANKH
jgi:hypothetical protein